MEVLSFKEKPDGSAIVELSMTEEENNILVQHAVIDILEKQINSLKFDEKRVCFDCAQEIDDETINKFPDTEICGDCLEEDSDEQRANNSD